ncbi:hypothetical protein [Pseudomonas congelans]|jgi:hypothetical protein|uniref:hypothetical protein n=1 Tax=Pseudomonas congelans TaxID=200452 RepID=UPI001BDCD116|nr:hypothetical protein [Pseudomonas congelans]QVX09745.1 hypothetical protein DBV21_07600 [Pseudomonas congelans]
MNQALAHYWLQWWLRPWQWADPSWSSVLGERQLSNDQFVLLSSLHPDHLGTAFGVQASSPVLPDALIVGLIQASEQRETVLAVVEHLCTARATRPLPNDDLRPWCRSIAKALRPGSWLPDEHIEPLQLLAQWCGEQQWQRLRLLWPRAMAMAVEPQPCNEPRRLDMLWRAALQRVLEEPHVHSPQA